VGVGDVGPRLHQLLDVDRELDRGHQPMTVALVRVTPVSFGCSEGLEASQAACTARRADSARRVTRPLAVAASLDRRLRRELLAASPGDGHGRREPALRKDRRVTRLPRESVSPVCREFGQG
jgi:hypothetical protein